MKGLRMFRLEDRQLHIIAGLLFGASILLFCMFGLNEWSDVIVAGKLGGTKDFSDAWVCTYEPLDEEQQKENTDEDGRTVQVINTPTVIPVKAGKEGKVVTLTRKLPEMDTEPVYLLLETERQKVQVQIGQTVIYTSKEADDQLAALHIIPVGLQYRNSVVSIELTGQPDEDMQLGAIREGRYSEVFIQSISDDGIFVIAGILFVSISLCLLVVWIFTKNKWRQKKLLLYGCLEGSLLGVLFLLESRLLQVVVNWNYGLYFAKACTIVIAAVLHLMVMRCFVYKKRVLFFMDMGILFYGIFYISMMVLQAFSLLSMDSVYMTAKILTLVGILLYTIVLAVTLYGYGRKEAAPGFYANGILVVFLTVWLALPVLNSYMEWRPYILTGGVLLYMILLWIFGLKYLIYVRTEEKKAAYDEEAVRKQLIEQLNPNLLFASFQTLQNLIKNGSANSVKMIYYISVYIRSNLKALEQRGEIIPFEEELEHIIAYLQLQKTRNHKLNFNMECKVREFGVPRHSLEPLVENAVKHGIAKNGNKGNVVVRTYQREEGYAIQIIDDGIGFDQHILGKDSPTALLNLFHLLEDRCEAMTEVISREGKGTVITIVLPMLDNELLEGMEEDV